MSGKSRPALRAIDLSKVNLPLSSGGENVSFDLETMSLTLMRNKLETNR